jgi:predicted Zn finger-like uncharacterized protein
MIVECENCHTKFRLDDTLLKETGSKVRCSVCSHKFIVFPPKAQKETPEEQAAAPREESRKEVDADLDKTIVADVIEKDEQEPSEEVPEHDQTLVEESPPSDEIEPVSFEDISQIDSGIIREESPDIGKAMERAAKVQEEVIAEEEWGREEKFPMAEEPVLPRPAIKKKKRSKTVLIVLIFILLLVGGASAVVLYMPELLPESLPFFQRPSKEQVFDMGNKRLSFSNLEGSFSESKTVGSLFVVTGLVANNYPDKRSFIRIRSNILDSKGKVAKSKIVYAGNRIPRKDLQTLSMEEINKRLMNSGGRDNSNINVAPHTAIPFMIVFANLPEDVSEFTVEAISSSPARK